MKELVVISLTTWSARINNIPVVLDTIYNQTVLPDKVVLNLAFDEQIPLKVQEYLTLHNVEVFLTEDTKVYKKFLPTLQRYPDACVINIDDDMLYPEGMVADFLAIHQKFPNNPVCGNHSFCCGRMCHCGEASLTKYEYFGKYLDYIDQDVMSNCPSSDMVFTYLATKAGHPYVPSTGYYGTDYTPAYQASSSWTINIIQKSGGVRKTFEYLEQRYGHLPGLYETYIEDPILCKLIEAISAGQVAEEVRNNYYKTESEIRNSKTHKLGKFILHPSFANFRRLLNK